MSDLEASAWIMLRVYMAAARAPCDTDPAEHTRTAQAARLKAQAIADLLSLAGLWPEGKTIGEALAEPRR